MDDDSIRKFAGAAIKVRLTRDALEDELDRSDVRRLRQAGRDDEAAETVLRRLEGRMSDDEILVVVVAGIMERMQVETGREPTKEDVLAEFHRLAGRGAPSP
jgi:hypothetical protein